MIYAINLLICKIYAIIVSMLAYALLEECCKYMLERYLRDVLSLMSTYFSVYDSDAVNFGELVYLA